MEKAEKRVIFLAFCLILLFNTVFASAEFMRWANPKKLIKEFGDSPSRTEIAQAPVIKALPNGNLVVAWMSNGLQLGIYNNIDDQIAQVTVNPSRAAHSSRESFTRVEWYSFYQFYKFARLAVSNDGKVTVAYKTHDSSNYILFFKQYTSDLQNVVIDSTPVVTATYDLDLGDIVVTPNGEIHMIYSRPTATGFGAYYKRFNSNGQPIGSEVAFYQSNNFVDTVHGMWAAATPNNAVDVLFAVGDEEYVSFSNALYRRRITDGVPGNRLHVSNPPPSTDDNNPGASIAVDRYENDFIAWWWQRFPWERTGSTSNSLLLLKKVDSSGNVLNSLQLTGFSFRNTETSPMSQVVIDGNNNKYIIWSDPRGLGLVRNLRFTKLGPNLETIINQQILMLTANEDWVQAAADPMGNVHIVYMNGLLSPNEAEAAQPQAFITRSTTSTIAVSDTTLPGQTARIDISSPNTPGKQYLVALSFGKSTFPLGGGYVFPLSLDSLFFMSVTSPGSWLRGATGNLDDTGSATISLDIPPWAQPGLLIYGAFIVYDPAQQPTMLGISLPARILVKEGVNP